MALGINLDRKVLGRLRELGWSMGVVVALAIPGPAWGQNPRAISISADVQEANANTGVFIATGNVTLSFPAERLTARAQRAVYYSQEQRIELEGQVTIRQGENQLQAEKVIYYIEKGTIQAAPAAGSQVESVYVLPEPTASP
ncbi:LPS export ABC transporter periplasmic protein LptC [Synechococcus sp. H55.7]|uniref:LptA/OstA family protein n=1 Tax=unclassified Synechococcus TaxID=2626047 RepID=UPI0039C48C68